MEESEVGEESEGCKESEVGEESVLRGRRVGSSGEVLPMCYLPDDVLALGTREAAAQPYLRCVELGCVDVAGAVHVDRAEAAAQVVEPRARFQTLREVRLRRVSRLSALPAVASSPERVGGGGVGGAAARAEGPLARRDSQTLGAWRARRSRGRAPGRSLRGSERPQTGWRACPPRHRFPRQLGPPGRRRCSMPSGSRAVVAPSSWRRGGRASACA